LEERIKGISVMVFSLDWCAVSISPFTGKLEDECELRRITDVIAQMIVVHDPKEHRSMPTR
jgi:hypothetical protein